MQELNIPDGYLSDATIDKFINCPTLSNACPQLILADVASKNGTKFRDIEKEILTRVTGCWDDWKDVSRAKTLAANWFSKTSQGGKKDGTDVNAPTTQPKLLVLDGEKWKSILDGLKKAMDQALNQHGQKTLCQGFTKFSPIPISLEWAYHLSTGCGEFVSQFPQGYMTISTPGHRLWCLSFAVHRSLILLFGDEAPNLVQLFRSYVMVAGESHILQDNIARQRFRIEQAGAFVNRTTRRLLNKTVQVGQLRRPREPVQTVFATLHPFCRR